MFSTFKKIFKVSVKMFLKFVSLFEYKKENNKLSYYSKTILNAVRKESELSKDLI